MSSFHNVSNPLQKIHETLHSFSSGERCPTISILSNSSISAAGSVPIFEKDCRLCTCPIREITGNSYVLEFYPEININRELFTSSALRSMDSYKNVMIPVNENALKRIIRTFFESGFNEALNEARSPQTASSSVLISSLAQYLHQALDTFNKIKLKFIPHLEEQGPEAIAKFSETRDLQISYIRCVVWHPNCFKIAVATCDDVRIYTDEPGVVPILKSGHQKCISSMAWRPFSASELAVGCQNGVCLWSTDHSIHIARTLSHTVHLTHPNHCPVTSVEWSPDGCLLATASISDADILIWDVDQQINSPLKRVGPPCSLLRWSPDRSYLFSATIGNVFRVWTTKNWTPERWIISKGFIQSAVWSPCSTFLLFVTSEEPILYKLQFIEDQLFATSTIPKTALPIADLSKVTLGIREIGGIPQSLSWDPTGMYLAIIFKDSSCVAIFSTSIKRQNLNISPSCFLTGIGTEYPCTICFQSKNRRNTDCVLTIGWSSGRIQYFPFINM